MKPVEIFKSYTVGADAPLTVEISGFKSYGSTDFYGVTQIGLTAGAAASDPY